jgi:hypothetical protein
VSTLTLSFADLPFGTPVDPTLSIVAFAQVASIFPEDAPDGATITGSLSADFASTVRVQSLLVTDSLGNPIPGVTVVSRSGFTYPLDPRNSAVPEPAWLSPFELLALALLRQFRSRSALQLKHSASCRDSA